VLGPLLGVGVALGGTVIGISEGDWVAAAVFMVPGVVLGWVAWRNARLRDRNGADQTPPPADTPRDSSTQ
jgi:hypothetical protein